MPVDAISLEVFNRQTQTSLTKQISKLSASAFEKPMVASTVTFRGTKYSLGQYVVLKVDHWTRQYVIGKILQCVIDSQLKGEKVKFVLRQYAATENITGVLTVKDKTELSVTAISEITDYYPLKALKGRASTIVLHHYISCCSKVQ
jgi:hypothetical protein